LPYVSLNLKGYKYESFRVFQNRWQYVIVAIIALMFGAAIGPSQTEITNAQNDAKDLEKQLSTKSKTIASLESQNKDLQEKVDEAAPWFEMKEDERKQLKAEAKA
jgi:peptidoglycan hydrolase CwlO-like protein